MEHPIRRFLGESWFANHWLASKDGGEPYQVWELDLDVEEIAGVAAVLERWRPIAHPALTPIRQDAGAKVFIVEDDRGPDLATTAGYVRDRLGIDPTPFVIAHGVELGRAIAHAADRLGTGDRCLLHGTLTPSALYAAVTDDPRWPVRIRMVPPVSTPRPGGGYRGGYKSSILPPSHFNLPIDERDSAGTDVWQLGFCLYLALIGHDPYQGDPAESLARFAAVWRSGDPPPPPSSFGARTPAAVERALGGALRRNPGDRYPSVAALVDALAATGVAAPLPPDTDEPLRAWVRAQRDAADLRAHELVFGGFSLSPCKVPWDEMAPLPGTDGHRHCARCDTAVVPLRRDAAVPLPGKRCVVIKP